VTRSSSKTRRVRRSTHDQLRDLEAQREGLLKAFPLLLKWKRTIDPTPEQVRLEHLNERISRLRLRSLQTKNTPTVEQPRTPGDFASADFFHSDDYRTLNFRGVPLSLTPGQARIVQFLHSEFLSGRPEVSQQRVLAEAEIKTSRFRDTFRNSGLFGKGKLITPCSRRGMVRLNIPG
jgi:hypothetical protein